ncbi:hypothetical protein BDF22DRAFT_739070 [Syncephalis plumigaleata]|nr:hypothetical protein BDF22DRAFT_739070 [Syncephalis plumigaleata]
MHFLNPTIVALTVTITGFMIVTTDAAITPINIGRQLSVKPITINVTLLLAAIGPPGSLHPMIDVPARQVQRSLDLTKSAFKRIASLDDGDVAIKWTWGSCD